MEKNNKNLNKTKKTKKKTYFISQETRKGVDYVSKKNKIQLK